MFKSTLIAASLAAISLFAGTVGAQAFAVHVSPGMDDAVNEGIHSAKVAKKKHYSIHGVRGDDHGDSENNEGKESPGHEGAEHEGGQDDGN